MQAPEHFDEFLVLLLKFEGEKYENVPGDSGGPTKFGIDQRSHPGVDIRNLTRSQAREIYISEYWEHNCTRLPFPLDYAHFDADENQGDIREVKQLQEAVKVKQDGVWGPITQEAVEKALKDPGALLEGMIGARVQFYRRHAAAVPKDQKFLNGWLTRCQILRTWCHNRMTES